MDLNADLGEEAGDDAALLRIVTSAAVACGFHAGGPVVMARTVAQAGRDGVVLGAHPSYADREGFGRRDMDVAHDDLVAVVAYQVGALAAITSSTRCGRLGFVKLHGALYNRAGVDDAVADAVAEALAGGFPELAVLCQPGSALARRAPAAGLAVFREGFADRAYLPDGRLAARSEPGAVLHDPAEVAAQAVRLASEGQVDSICLHGDTAGAVELAVAVRRALEDAGVEIAPFCR